MEGWWDWEGSSRKDTSCVSEFGFSSRMGGSDSFSISDSGECDASGEALGELSSPGEETVSSLSGEAVLEVEQEAVRLSP